MGFRFKKSKNFGPFRVNFSSSGIGYSIGCKGFRYTKKANGGTRTTYSIPNSGISYVNENGKSVKNSVVNFNPLFKILTFPFWFPFIFLYFIFKIIISSIIYVIKAIKEK